MDVRQSDSAIENPVKDFADGFGSVHQSELRQIGSQVEGSSCSKFFFEIFFDVARSILGLACAFSTGDDVKVFQRGAALATVFAGLEKLAGDSKATQTVVVQLKKEIASTQELEKLLDALAGLNVLEERLDSIPQTVMTLGRATEAAGIFQHYASALNSDLEDGFSPKEVSQLAQLVGTAQYLLQTARSWVVQAQAVQQLRLQLESLRIQLGLFQQNQIGTVDLNTVISAVQMQIYTTLSRQVSNLYFISLTRPDLSSILTSVSDLTPAKLTAVQTYLETQQISALVTAATQASEGAFAVFSLDLPNGVASWPLFVPVSWPVNKGTPAVSSFGARFYQANVVWTLGAGSCQYVQIETNLTKLG